MRAFALEPMRFDMWCGIPSQRKRLLYFVVHGISACFFALMSISRCAVGVGPAWRGWHVDTDG